MKTNRKRKNYYLDEKKIRRVALPFLGDTV
jgi:hypothetical protein